jgi:two-component system CheB/CheR fusion protein
MSADPTAIVPDEFAPAPSHIEFPVVGVGASAGGIGALLKLFEHMPERTGMAFVVILHLSPRHESNVDAILRRVTRMPVSQVEAPTPIEADHVYVISPARALSMSDGQLMVSNAERPRGGHVAIDLFFRTLADTHRDRAVSIVLSGTGSDGAVGLRRIKERGGVTLAQSPGDAEYDGMPLSAIGTGAVDFVLPVVDMPAKLTDIWHNAQHIELPHPERAGLRVGKSDDAAATRAEEALADVMVLLRSRTGHDFRHYKRATVLRRIERRMQVVQVPTLPAYRAWLEAHPEETTHLLKDLLISVTSFFRDREAWEALEQQVDATLIEPQHEGARLRAWVPGCATGEEAYSLAMLLVERVAAVRKPIDVQVFASDIDERAIAVGRAGSYASGIVADVPAPRLRQFFTREQGSFRVRKELRERLLFSIHNLLRDPPFSRLDIVCCRNLLIYLDREVQAQVLEMLHFALQPGGLLFLGSSESADAAAAFYTLIDKRHRIYRANSMLRRARHVPGARPLPEPEPPPARSPLADLHRRLLEQHAEPSVLLDADANILHSSEGAVAYLQFASGAPTQNLLSVIRPELRLELRATLFQAQQTGEPTPSQPLRFERERRAVALTMRVLPVHEGVARFVLVRFEERALDADEARPPPGGGDARAAQAAAARGRAGAHARAAPRHDRPHRDLGRGAEGEQRGAAGDQRGAALDHRGARDQQGGAAVGQRGADHRQPRAEEQGRRDRQDQRRPEEPDRLDRHRDRLRRSRHAHQALHAARRRAVQPDRRRRRPLADGHHAPARLRRAGG